MNGDEVVNRINFDIAVISEYRCRVILWCESSEAPRHNSENMPE